MCYTIKECLYVLVILALGNGRVSCSREDYLTKNNIVTSLDKKDFNPFTSSENDPFDPFNSNERYIDEENYSGRVIFPDDDYSSYERTTSTTRPSPQEFQACVKACSTNTTFDPVCGTDNITYTNLEQLECRIKCGDDVSLRELSACNENFQSTTLLPVIESEIFKSCLLLCPSTQEYNPVCGTDNITYYNYGKMVCARICGADVQVERHAPCPKQPTTTTESILPSSSIRPYELSKEFLVCLQFCPTTSEYNPVCGTNDKTYYNIGKLYCAKSCGVDVTVLKHSPCSIEISISLNINNNENKVSTTTTTTTTPRTVDDFTIPQDLLDSIFHSHENDETKDIDIRNKDLY